MDKKYSTLIKNMGYLLMGNFASKILVFLLVPLYTSVLTTGEFGSYDAIITTVQFIAPIVVLNISDGVMRFLMDGKRKNEIYAIGQRYVCLGIAVMGIFCFLNYVFKFLNFLNGYELYCFIYSVFFILNNYFVQVAKGLNEVSVMAKGGVIGTFSMLCSNILLLLVFKRGIQGFFIANILGQALPVIYYLWKFKIKVVLHSKIEHDLQKQMLIYSVPLIFNTIGWTINSSLDKYCVIYFCGIEVSALVAIAYKIPTILSVVYAIFTQAWQISAINAYNNKDRNAFYSQIFLLTNGLGAVLCAVLLVGNQLISKILFAKDFYQAWKFVPFLLLSIMFNQTAGFIGPLLSAKKESNAMAKAAVIGSISNLIFNIVLIQLFGAQGAVVATAISSFIIYFVRWWYARNLLNSEIYPVIYITWILLLIGSFAEVVLETHIVQCVVLVLIIIINKQSLLAVLNKIMKRGK